MSSDESSDESSGRQPEYIGSDASAAETGAGDGAPARRRRTGLVAVAAVAVVVVGGVGAYGVAQLMGGGDSPAAAVPANAVGYLSLDLDPSASQKIEAIKILRKFPALRSELGISSRDDLRRTLVEKVEKDCPGLDYDTDVEPWIGERVAVAAVPSTGSTVVPLLVLQVGDQDKARAGVRKLESCDLGDGAARGGTARKPGVAFSGDYLLLTEKAADATRMAAAADDSALADDSDFTTWMGRVGDPGIVTMYASKNATTELASSAERLGGSASATSMLPSTKALTSQLKDFEGAAGVVRFHDGAVETELATQGLNQSVTATKNRGPSVTDLPSSTAAAFSVAFADGWLDRYLKQIQGAVGASRLDQVWAQGEEATGLQLPEDISTLLGTGVSVSLDSSVDLRSLGSAPDPATIPAGIRIQGDTAKITAIIDKLRALAGPDAGLVQVRSADGVVAVGTDKAYVARLLDAGHLGESDTFSDVVPDADRATSVLYVSFDAGGGWAQRLGDLLSDGDAKVRANLAPLDALGVSSWVTDDKVQHGLIRLTTD